MHSSHLSLTVAEVTAQGVTLTTAEALAIVQSLIETSGDEDARPPYGPPLPENIVIRIDGSVRSRACAVTPTVLEVAILLDRLLPPGHRQVPGALRYTLGRALHEVAGPPFDSLDTFSQALRRFEAGGRRTEIVREVIARAATQELGAATARAVFGLPFAAAILAGVALIGAGESMRPSRSIGMAAVQPPPLIDSRPIVFNPPPTAVLLPERRDLVPAVRHADASPRRVLANRALKQPQRPRRLGALTRVIPRVRIRFDEL